MKSLLLSTFAVALALTGCGAQAADETTPVDQSPAPSSASPEPSPTPTPPAEKEPEPTYATEAQVASVIGKYIDEWQKVIDEAGDCRFVMVLAEEGSPEALERLSCYMREATMSMTAQTAARDIRALEVPPSMGGLVQDTLEALDKVAAADVDAHCMGSREAEESDACTQAIGSAYAAYTSLDRILGGWSPYL